MIISCFIETIKEKIDSGTASKIYGIDLFPECSFVYYKPVQTHGDNPSEEWNIEIDKMTNELDLLMNSYDIALVSAGGYGNLLCNYIYETNKKSAIYVGGVLQMYFGIIGQRWIKERPDIISLFKNEYWTVPSEKDRPSGYKKVEGGTYW